MHKINKLHYKTAYSRSTKFELKVIGEFSLLINETKMNEPNANKKENFRKI